MGMFQKGTNINSSQEHQVMAASTRSIQVV